MVRNNFTYDQDILDGLVHTIITKHEHKNDKEDIESAQILNPFDILAQALHKSEPDH